MIKKNLSPPNFPIFPDLSDTKEYLNITQEDLNLYFADTFLFIKEKGWEYVNNINIGSANKKVLNLGAPNPLVVENSEIYFCFPEVGLYNFKRGVVNFRRKTYRQNKKALCRLTGEVYNTLSLFTGFCSVPYGFSLSQTWKWSSSNLNCTFSQRPYPDFEQAFIGVTKLKDFAKAIDRNFFIGQGISSKPPSLWFRETLIGKCLKKDRILIENPAFLQEAVDFFSPRGLTVESSRTL